MFKFPPLESGAEEKAGALMKSGLHSGEGRIGSDEMMIGIHCSREEMMIGVRCLEEVMTTGDLGEMMTDHLAVMMTDNLAVMMTGALGEQMIQDLAHGDQLRDLLQVVFLAFDLVLLRQLWFILIFS